MTSNILVLEIGIGPGYDFKHTSSRARDWARAMTSNILVLEIGRGTGL